MSEAEGRSHLIHLPSSVKWRGGGSSTQDLRHQITLFPRLKHRIMKSTSRGNVCFHQARVPGLQNSTGSKIHELPGDFVSFMGYVLLETWSSSRIQPPKKKQLEKSQPSTYCVILWRQMNKCHRKKKEFSLTQLDTVAWNFKCDTVTHGVKSQDVSHSLSLRFFRCLVPNQLPSRIQRAHIGTLRPIFAGRF